MNAEHDLVDRVRLSLAAERVRSGGEGPSPSRVAAVVRTQDRLLGDTAVLDTAEAVRRDLVGAGPLQPLLALPGVTDVLVQGPDRVWIDRGAGLELVDVRFDDDAAVRRLAQRLASTAGRRLDDATPYVDARLPDGTRLHAVLAPVSSEGTCVSLRTTVRRAFTLDQLVQAGSLVPAAADLLDRIVRARLAYVVSGGTGTGKTTLLSTLLSLVPSDERIVVVEDSRELAPDHPHVVHLEARPANLEGAGEICLRTLVRQAMRMRPDRLVVGEVRGAEVVVLLAALNTGHEGGCGTLHANSAIEVPARIEALGVAAGVDRAAVHSQLAAAVDVVVHVVRDRDGGRRLAQLCVLEQGADGLVSAREAVRFDGDDVVDGPGSAVLEAMFADRLGTQP